jgi:hypothetical protein
VSWPRRMSRDREEDPFNPNRGRQIEEANEADRDRRAPPQHAMLSSATTRNPPDGPEHRLLSPAGELATATRLYFFAIAKCNMCCNIDHSIVVYKLLPVVADFPDRTNVFYLTSKPIRKNLCLLDPSAR